MATELVHVISVKPLSGFRLQLKFSDKARRIVNVERILSGPVFGSLKNPSKFAKVRVNKRFGCIEWPNGADLCPDALRHCSSKL